MIPLFPVKIRELYELWCLMRNVLPVFSLSTFIASILLKRLLKHGRELWKGSWVIPVKSHPKFDKRVKLKINVHEGPGWNYSLEYYYKLCYNFFFSSVIPLVYINLVYSLDPNSIFIFIFLNLVQLLTQNIDLFLHTHN